MMTMAQPVRHKFGAILTMVLASMTIWIGAPSAEASRLPAVIASVSADVPISAGDGWLVWSVPVEGGWGLDAYHDGAITALPVASRPQPFDANVGTNAQQVPVVAFSRCTKTPQMENIGSGVTGGSMLVPRTGAGCRLRVLDLMSDRENSPPIPHPAGASDTTPSMWHGNVAFARMTSGHGAISHVMFWSPRHPDTLRVLAHGQIPPRCARKKRCGGSLVYGEVQALDLDAHVVAFTWAIDGAGVLGHGGWEARVDDLSNARGGLADSGFVSEACISGGIELERLEAPVAVGDGMLVSELIRSGCYRTFASRLYDYRAGGARPSSGALPDMTLGLAKDGDALYALAAPAPESQTDPGCSPSAPCTLEQIAKPVLTPTRFRPQPPLV
jgi:hypothetical protein